VYNCMDSAMCAKQIERVFEDDNLAAELSRNGRKVALGAT